MKRWVFFKATGFFSLMFGMDWSRDGAPFVSGHTKNTSLVGMDYSSEGAPFVIWKKS